MAQEVFTCSPVSLLAHRRHQSALISSGCCLSATYIVLFRQLTGIASPSLYVAFFRGCRGLSLLTAAESEGKITSAR